MGNYNEQAKNFLAATQTTIEIVFLKNDYHFSSDTSKRDIYKVTFKRGQRSFTVEYGQSTMNSAKLVDGVMGDEFTMSGACLKGRLTITGDVEKYKRAQGLREVKGIPPTAYDVLACLQKYEIGDLENFCEDMGLSSDSIKARKLHKAVEKEYNDVCKIWSDEEIGLLQEIE